MSQPIPWQEWEGQAARLHRSLQSISGSPASPSATRELLARMLGFAHWHELDRALRPAGRLRCLAGMDARSTSA